MGLNYNMRSKNTWTNSNQKKKYNQIIEWLTGFDKDELQVLIEEKVTFRTVFQKTKIHPNAHLIKGVVCGDRIEEIEVELARGRKMEKILRVGNLKSI